MKVLSIVLALMCLGVFANAAQTEPVTAETDPVTEVTYPGAFYQVSILWGLIKTSRCQPCECDCYTVSSSDGSNIEVGSAVNVTIYPSTGSLTRMGEVVNQDADGSFEVYVEPEE